MDHPQKSTSRKTMPTLFALTIITVGLVWGVALVNENKDIAINAKENAAPNEVRVSNIESDSLSVSWVTKSKVTGYLVWGKNENTKNIVLESFEKPSYNHVVNLKNLEPSTTYFFRIYSHGILFENDNIPWQGRTTYKFPGTVPTFMVSGVVTDEYTNPINNALVYLTVGGGSPLSTLTTKNGSFVVDISKAKTQSLENYIKINKDSTLIEIVVKGNASETASAQVYPKNANPINPIVMGLAQNFKKSQTNSGFVPSSTVNIPK